MKTHQLRGPLPSLVKRFSISGVRLALFLSMQLLLLRVAHAEIVLLNTTADTRLMSIFPDNNEGTSPLLAVFNNGSTNIQRSLLQFNVGMLPANQQINSALLRLTADNSASNPTNQPMTVHRVTRSWSESSASWNNASSGNPWTMPGGDFSATISAQTNTNPNAGELVTWDVTDLVRSWYSGAETNHGLLLRSTPGNSLHFFSSNSQSGPGPSLSVDITAVPEPSSMLLMTGLAVGAVCFRRIRRKSLV